MILQSREKFSGGRMKTISIIDYYYNRVYKIILIIVPLISLLAAVMLSWHTITVSTTFKEMLPAIIFDFINIIYLCIAGFYLTTGFNIDGTIKLAKLKQVKWIIAFLLIFQWNYLTYNDASTEIWGYIFLFIIIAAFFLDMRMLLWVELGLVISSMISYLIIGDLLIDQGEYLVQRLISRAVGFFVTVFAINSLTFFCSKYLVNEVEKISNYDTLTHLLNRRTLNARIALAEKEAKEKDKPFSVAIFDLDDFKQINDTYGHENGDIVLKTFADILYRGVKSIDYVFRWGGEEFLVVFSCEKSQAVAAAERVLREIENYPFEFNGEEVRMTATCGIAGYVHNSNASMLIEIADSKLYVGKNNGKNQVVS
jgi:diguanylate cyclase (GGDEF)-like protein